MYHLTINGYVQTDTAPVTFYWLAFYRQLVLMEERESKRTLSNAACISEGAETQLQIEKKAMRAIVAATMCPSIDEYHKLLFSYELNNCVLTYSEDPKYKSEEERADFLDFRRTNPNRYQEDKQNRMV